MYKNNSQLITKRRFMLSFKIHLLSTYFAEHITAYKGELKNLDTIFPLIILEKKIDKR